MAKFKEILQILGKIGPRIVDIMFPRSENVRMLEETSADELAALLPRAKNPPDRRMSALFDYKSAAVRAAVWEIKYRGNKNIARKMATLLHEEMLDAASDSELFDGGAGMLLVPMPISGARKRMRGFNQAELVCEAIMLLSEGFLSYAPGILEKTKDTEPQTSLARARRLENLVGAFAVPRPDDVYKKHIILVDDVITTGATALEAAKTLRAAGARSVRVFAIAH
jgi:ComF family protein